MDAFLSKEQRHHTVLVGPNFTISLSLSEAHYHAFPPRSDLMDLLSHDIQLDTKQHMCVRPPALSLLGPDVHVHAALLV